MFQEDVRQGFEVFIHDGDKAIGAVRQFSPHGRRELVIYIENAGDFVVNRSKLNHRLWQAIGHAHDAEDPD